MKTDSTPFLQTVVWHPLTNIGAVPASAGFNFGVYIDQGKVVKADDALPELQLSAPGQILDQLLRSLTSIRLLSVRSAGQRALGRPWVRPRLLLFLLDAWLTCFSPVAQGNASRVIYQVRLACSPCPPASSPP